MTRAERRLKTEFEESAALWILREFIHERGSYEGPASWILQHLDARATDAQRNAKDWPKTPQVLGRLLTKFAATLENRGTTVSQSRHGKRGRLWLLSDPSSPQFDGTTIEKSERARRHSPGYQPDLNQIDAQIRQAREFLRRLGA